VKISGRLTGRTAVIRALVGLVVVLAVLLGAFLMPVPSVGRLRDWADSFGPSFVWIFFIGYAVIAIGPVPRSAFTAASGLLFGPLVGFIGAMLATVFAALMAFVLVRRFGRERIRPYLRHPVARSVELRMERRGWLAVGSLRLIAAFPFSVTNYVAALSSIKFVPYALATVIGVAPGTAAVVILGNALAGDGDPVMLALSAVLFSVGVFGLILDTKLGVKEPVDGGVENAGEPADEPLPAQDELAEVAEVPSKKA
jgi:uncharacterized membrane protein YdjX (TVP38/TMEM64 family)